MHTPWSVSYTHLDVYKRQLSEDAAREIGKPQGRYLTLELDALIRREEEDVYKRQV